MYNINKMDMPARADLLQHAEISNFFPMLCLANVWSFKNDTQR